MRSKMPLQRKPTASFEPMLDYCVVKMPRLPFDKFISAKRALGNPDEGNGRGYEYLHQL